MVSAAITKKYNSAITFLGFVINIFLTLIFFSKIMLIQLWKNKKLLLEYSGEENPKNIPKTFHPLGCALKTLKCNGQRTKWRVSVHSRSR